MPYTNWSNVNNATAFLQTANTNTSGYFWPSILYMVVALLFFAMLNFGFEAAALVSLFIGIIIGTLLVYMDLVSMLSLGVLVGAELFLFIYLMFSSSKNQ